MSGRESPGTVPPEAGDDWGPPPCGFFESGALEVARRLVGCLLLTTSNGAKTGGVIVETEAYTADDRASHSYFGPTRRNASMFRRGGVAYVYLSYGVHFCFNVVTGPEGVGEAVLVRAIEPLAGRDAMIRRRGVADPLLLASGPGRLCEALGIDLRHDGMSLAGPEMAILVRAGAPGPEVATSARIGISRDADLKRRFFIPGSPYVSRGNHRSKEPLPGVSGSHPRDGSSRRES